MNDMRPYRFPPLAQLAPGAGDDNQWQAALADGFEQGRADGYRVGQESGRQDGYAGGRHDGVQQGRDEGLRQTLANFAALAQPVDALLANLKSIQADYQSAQRKEVVELVAKVARQVIRAELALQPAQLLTLVDETLAAMPPTRDGIEVYLNPEELARIQELDAARAARWNLIADARLEPGECRVKAGDHEADAGCRQRLAACIEQVSTQLQDAADRASAGETQ